MTDKFDDRLERLLEQYQEHYKAGRISNTDAWLEAQPEEFRQALREEIGLLEGLLEAPADVPASVGDYDILTPLGEGGMGVVYLGRDRTLDRDVAVKLTRVDPRFDDVQRFHREAKLLARLEHDRVVRVYTGGMEGSWAWIAMERMDGSLHEVLKGRGPLPLDDAVDFINDAAAGVLACHEVGVVHRDVKPSNLLLDRQGRVKLADFGISARADAARLTRTGQHHFTPAYAAPELHRGDAPTIAMDVFGLGVTLHALLAGDHPGRADLPDSVPVVLRAVISKAMRPTPTNRHPGVEAFLRELQDALQRESERPEVGGDRPPEGDADSNDGSTLPAGAVVPAPDASPSAAADRQRVLGVRVWAVPIAALGLVGAGVMATMLVGRKHCTELRFAQHNSSFLLCDERRTWAEARAACQACGGDLAVFNNEEERLTVVNGIEATQAHQRAREAPWAVGYRRSADASFEAVDESGPPPKGMWNVNQPDHRPQEDCVSMIFWRTNRNDGRGDHSWGLNDHPCYGSGFSVCELPPGPGGSACAR